MPYHGQSTVLNHQRGELTLRGTQETLSSCPTQHVPQPRDELSCRGTTAGTDQKLDQNPDAAAAAALSGRSQSINCNTLRLMRRRRIL